MQPTCRQVPPRNGSFSTTAVFSPHWLARIAATYPPGPLPIITRSYLAKPVLPYVLSSSRYLEWKDRFDGGASRLFAQTLDFSSHRAPPQHASGRPRRARKGFRDKVRSAYGDTQSYSQDSGWVSDWRFLMASGPTP